MFVSKNLLPHILGPPAYFCPEHFQVELARIFEPSWTIVGSCQDLPKDGDFLTTDVFGVPILVRNIEGKIHSFLNVCPHRHCMLTSEPAGNTDQLKCQYHGWQFKADGSTGYIPDAKCFRPMPGGPECLKKFPTEMRGPMIFVSLQQQPEPLEEQQPTLMEVCDEFPAQRWRQAERWHYDLHANWKIVAENTVESYHVPTVHPKTLVSFGPEENIEHIVLPDATIMRASIVAPAVYRLLARLVLPRLDPQCTQRYQLHHGFPHLFFIRIDAMLQVMTLLPTSPECCRMTVHIFTLRGPTNSLVSRLLTRLWAALKIHTVKRVLAEDIRFYKDIQKGIKASPFRGTVSTREELVHAFQAYVAAKCESS